VSLKVKSCELFHSDMKCTFGSVGCHFSQAGKTRKEYESKTQIMFSNNDKNSRPKPSCSSKELWSYSLTDGNLLFLECYIAVWLRISKALYIYKLVLFITSWQMLKLLFELSPLNSYHAISKSCSMRSVWPCT